MANLVYHATEKENSHELKRIIYEIIGSLNCKIIVTSTVAKTKIKITEIFRKFLINDSISCSHPVWKADDLLQLATPSAQQDLGSGSGK